MRERAQVVVIGGGVGGCAVAYWLTKLGWSDVVVLERADLTSGSTFHSAGLVGQLRGSLSLTKMMMSSVELYRTLGDEVGLETGWHEVGSLRLASSEERMEELARQAGWAKTFGLPLELISAEEAQRLFPPMSTDGVLGAAHLPTDGYIDPSQLTFALAEGARRGGAEINTHTRVTGIEVERGRVTGVETDKGRIETETVVNAGGMFAAELGALAGVTVPIVPFAHEYLVTRPAGLPLDLPTMRDPSLLVYFRGESGGLIMGGYERHSGAVGPRRHPGRLQRPLARGGLGSLPGADGERDRARADARGRRGRAARERARGVHARRRVHPRPDRRPRLLGRSRLLRARPGREPAGWGSSSPSGSSRASRASTSGRWTRAASVPTIGVATTRSPARTRSTPPTTTSSTPGTSVRPDARSASPPPTRDWQKLGAAFGEKSGWERANWFEPNAAAGDESLRPRGWAGRLWSPAIGAEHRATREAAALFDETSFAKIEVSGDGAADFLERLCANKVARDVGAITYTSMLNQRGGIECDFTVTRLAEDRFRIVTGTAFGRHDLAWIRSHAPDDGSVQVEDVTSRFACLGIWGPRSRDILEPLAGPLDFPYMRAQEIAVGPVPCLALRVTYVGELGWELYCPTEFGLRLWDEVWAAGRDHGLVAGGYRAIDSCRLEKGYRVWGADITPDDTPWEAGLGFAVKLDKGDFIGREALIAKQDPERKLACIVLEDPRSVALGSEPVRIEGDVVGRVTSGGYGYTVERSIAYAYVPAVRAEVGRPVEIEIFGAWVGGEVAAEPLYDPKSVNVRA